jgi:hypothetical protein
MNRTWRLILFQLKDNIPVIVVSWLLCLLWTYNLLMYHERIFEEEWLQATLESIVFVALLFYPTVFRVQNFQLKLRWTDYFRKEIQFLSSFPVNIKEIINSFYLEYWLLENFHAFTIYVLLYTLGLFDQYQLLISPSQLINIILIHIGISLMVISISAYMQYSFSSKVFYYASWAYLLILYAIFFIILLLRNESIMQLLIDISQQWKTIGGIILFGIGNLFFWISNRNVMRKFQ